MSFTLCVIISLTDDVDTGDADTGDAAGDDFVDVHLPLPIDTEMDRPGEWMDTSHNNNL